MTDLIKRQPEGKLIKSLMSQVCRSSLIFVGLSAITYWLISRQEIPVTITLIAKFSLSITIASAVARYGFKWTYRSTEARTFVAQFCYFFLLFCAGSIFTWCMSLMLPQGFPFEFNWELSFWSVVGTLAVDSIYTFWLDGMSPSHQKNLD